MPIQKTQLNVEGMHCGSCAMGIQMMLSTNDGVKNASVDYNTKKGEVEFDDSVVQLDKLLKDIEEAGYKATPA